jgi:hypothetical protein
MLKMRFLMLAPFLLLGACNPNEPVRVVNTTSYPNLPDIILPPNADLESVMFNVPGDLSQQLIKNTDECQSVPASQRNRVFWVRCGDYRDASGNQIYVTLDKPNFERLRANLSKLRVRDQQFQYRVDEVNKQRQDWRNQNNAAVGLPPEMPLSDGVLRAPAVIPGS